jgi:1,4-dihydroxy-2-naphthoyl-CoA hydrolase
MALAIKLPDFNQEIADAFIGASNSMTGLPEFLGVQIVHAEPGMIRAEMPVTEKLLTPIGNMHGGVLAAICDHVLGCVCYPHMKKGQWAATTEFKLNLLAPVTEGTVVAEARLVSMTKSTAVVRIDVSNEGRVCCAAQGTVLIRDPRPK